MGLFPKAKGEKDQKTSRRTSLDDGGQFLRCSSWAVLSAFITPARKAKEPKKKLRATAALQKFSAAKMPKIWLKIVKKGGQTPILLT